MDDSMCTMNAKHAKYLQCSVALAMPRSSFFPSNTWYAILSKCSGNSNSTILELIHFTKTQPSRCIVCPVYMCRAV